MSQRIVTECDECATLGETREAVTVEVRALGIEVDIDLCDVHVKPLNELVGRLAELGRKPSEAGVLQATCPRCGRRFASPQALGRHAKNEHGEKVSALRSKAPAPAAEPATRDAFACPECGRGFGKAQGMAVHRRRSHGVKGAEHRPDEAHAGE
jgi:uncharacterized C2H2 Zn-finger protein